MIVHSNAKHKLTRLHHFWATVCSRIRKAAQTNLQSKSQRTNGTPIKMEERSGFLNEFPKDMALLNSLNSSKWVMGYDFCVHWMFTQSRDIFCFTCMAGVSCNESNIILTLRKMWKKLLLLLLEVRYLERRSMRAHWLLLDPLGKVEVRYLIADGPHYLLPATATPGTLVSLVYISISSPIYLLDIPHEHMGNFTICHPSSEFWGWHHPQHSFSPLSNQPTH